MQERRKHKRFEIAGMDIQCKMMLATNVELLNISLGGAALQTGKKLNIGSKYTLMIKAKDKTISLKSSVVWEKLIGSKKNKFGDVIPIYQVGMIFDDILTDTGVSIINYIESYIVKEPEKQRLKGLRVEILEPEKVTILGYHESYSAIKISMGGLLIETSQQFKVDSKVKMEITFPENEYSIKFLGRIASCMEIPDKVPKKFAVGIEFIEISKQDKSKLKEFIDSL